MLRALKPFLAALCVLALVGCGGQKTNPNPGGGGGEGGGSGGGAGGGTAANTAPVLGELGAVAVDEGATLEVALSASDADGDTLSFDIANNPSFVKLTSKTIEITPDFDVVTSGASKSFDITVTVNDGAAGHSTTGTLALTVKAKNRAPTIAPLSNVSMVAGQTGAITVNATDADGDAVTLSLDSSAPAWASVNGLSLEFAPPPSTSFNQQLTVTASDGTLTSSQTFTLTVSQAVLTGTVAINSGAQFTKDPAVTLALTGTSTAGTISQMRFSNDGTTFSAFEAFAASKSWTLDSTSDGQKTVTVELQDGQGNSQQFTANITLDTGVPTISAFTINNGATATKDGSVLLNVTANDTGSGIGMIEASNDGATFTALSSNPSNWTLPTADGSDTVTIRVSDKAGNSATSTATILRDSTAPTITAAALNGGATWSRSGTVGLQVTASDGTSGSGLWQICLSGDVAAAGCVANTASSFQVALSSGDGQKQVSVTVTDNAGNASTATVASISVDSTPPAAQSLTIDNGAAATNNLTLSMATVAADPSPGSGLNTIEFSGDLLNWSTPQPFASPLSYTVAAGDGARTYYARLTDVAGNVSVSPYTSSSIKIDQTPPTGGSVVVNNSAAFTNTTAVTLALTGTDATSSVAQVCVKSGTMPLTMATPAATDPCWVPFSASMSYTLTPTADGNQRVFAFLMDAAGNILTNAVTDDIFLDRQTPSTPSNITISSVSYRTITFNVGTPATDPGAAQNQSSGVIYQVGFRIQGSTSPFMYVNATFKGGNNYSVNLSAANNYELVVRASDNAGNVTPSSSSLLASTYFVWTSQWHTPIAQPNTMRAAAVIGGTNFVVGHDGASDGPLTVIDNADGLATMKRLDASAKFIVPVGSTQRALFATGGQGFFTADMGTTFWPMNVSGGTVNAGTLLKSTVVNGRDVDSFVLVGSSGSIYRGDITSGGGQIPSGSFTRTVLPTPTYDLNSVAACSGCSGDVLVAVGANSYIVRSTDGGATWTAINAPANSGWLYAVVNVPGSQLMYAIGNTLLKSTDGGATWNVVTTPAFGSGYAMAVAGDINNYILWILPTFGTGVTRFDGTNRTVVSMPAMNPPLTTNSWFGVAALGTGSTAQAVVVGDNGEVVHIANNGATVTRRSSGYNSAIVLGLSFAEGSSDNALMVNSNGGGVFSTANHGQVWTAENANTAQQLRAVYQFADLSAVAAGGGGAVMKRSTAGVWSAATYTGGTPPATQYYGLACASTTQCVIVGTGASIAAYDPASSSFNTLTSATPANGVSTYQGAALVKDSTSVVHGIVVGYSYNGTLYSGTLRTCTGCNLASSYLPESTVPNINGYNSPRLYAVGMRPGGRTVAVGTGGSFGNFWTNNNYGVGGFTATNNSSLGFTVKSVINVGDTNTWYAAGDRDLGISRDDGATWQSLLNFPSTYGYTDLWSMAIPSTATTSGPMLIGGSYGLLMYSATGGL